MIPPFKTLLSCLFGCAFAAASFAQTVSDLALPPPPAADPAASAASTPSAAKPTPAEIAAERARLERMRNALAAERAALEKYRAELARQQQQIQARQEPAQKPAQAAETEQPPRIEPQPSIQPARTTDRTTVIPPPAKADPAPQTLSPAELQRQRQLAIERAQAIQKAIAIQKAVAAQKAAQTAASASAGSASAAAAASVRPDKDVKTMKLRSIVLNKIKYVHLRDIAVNYGLTFAYTQSSKKVSGAAIYDKTRKAVFSLSQREGSINGVSVHFLSPMILHSGEPYVTELDFLTIVDPLLRNKTAVKYGMKTIMIDPGHGGSDPGALYGKHVEKTYALQIAQKLRVSLEKLGFRVIMTRTGDTYPSLKDRAALCKKFKPDLYISIHCNAAVSKTPAGIETYRVVPVGGTETKGSAVKTAKQPANAFDANNSRLAFEMQKGMVAASGASDRGIRHQAIYVIANATCPAVLLEVGYLSNDAEAKKIATAAYQNKIVAGILAGMAGYGMFLR